MQWDYLVVVSLNMVTVISGGPITVTSKGWVTDLKIERDAAAVVT